MFIRVSFCQCLAFSLALTSIGLAESAKADGKASVVKTAAVYSLPGSPDTCYLMNSSSGAVIKDSCGNHDGALSGSHYTLSTQGITWNAGGSQIRTTITTLPRSVLACFTHQFGGTRYGDDVTNTFEKYPSLLTSDAASGSSISLEGQDGSQQGLSSANLGFLYFTERDSGHKRYVAATRDGTNGGPHCLILNRTHSGGDKFYLDGAAMGMVYDADTADGTLGNGNLIIGGRFGDPDFWFNGTLHLLVLWDTEALESPAAINQAMSWANDQLRIKGLPSAGSQPPHMNDLQSRFIIVGDSITVAAGIDPAKGEKRWAPNVKLKNPAIVTVPVAMGGLTGQFAAITSAWREATLIDPRAPFNVAQFYYGINDGCRNQFTEDQVWQRAVQWSRYMHSLGVRTLFTTMVDIGNSGNCGPHNETGATFKKNLNTLARGNYRGVFDAIVDFASDPELGADGASKGKCFGTDHVHPNGKCQDKMIQMSEDSANYVLDVGPTYVATSSYTMDGGDKTVIVLPTIATDSTITLPSCIGKTNMPYTIANGLPPSSTHVVDLIPMSNERVFGVSNQKIPVPAGTSLTLAPIVLASSVGGCTWIRM